MDRIIRVGHIGYGGEKGWIMLGEGICPCIPASTYKDPIKVVV